MISDRKKPPQRHSQKEASALTPDRLTERSLRKNTEPKRGSANLARGQSNVSRRDPGEGRTGKQSPVALSQNGYGEGERERERHRSIDRQVLITLKTSRPQRRRVGSLGFPNTGRPAKNRRATRARASVKNGARKTRSRPNASAVIIKGRPAKNRRATHWTAICFWRFLKSFRRSAKYGASKKVSEVSEASRARRPLSAVTSATVAA